MGTEGNIVSIIKLTLIFLHKNDLFTTLLFHRCKKVSS
jgi:hypothetical protein